jgi:uncharacterized protein YhbP (UPF0306 family)
MDTQALEYLHSQRVGVLALETANGSVHGATVHFAANADATKFFFLTAPTSRKMEGFAAKPELQATFVVGSSEADMRTLQIDGTARLLHEDERAEFESVYIGTFDMKKEKFSTDTPFVLIPTWWRFTDWTTPEGKRITCSEDTV